MQALSHRDCRLLMCSRACDPSQGLELYGGQAAGDVAQEGLRDPDSQFRLRTTRLLEKLGWQAQTSVEKGYWVVQNGNADEIVALGQAAVPALKTQLSHMGPDEQGFDFYFKTALRIDPSLRRVLAREWLYAVDTNPELAVKGLTMLAADDSSAQLDEDLAPIRPHLKDRGGRDLPGTAFFHISKTIQRSSDCLKLYGPPRSLPQVTRPLRSTVHQSLFWTLVGV